jgi:chromate transporter
MKSFSIKELFKIWSYVAAHSFGGPAGQIAVIHKLVVDDKKIINEKKFLHALNFCMLLPGPEAQQLATYMGWLMRGPIGGLIAGGLFILPGFLSILILSYIYVLYNDLTIVQGLFYGIKPAIIAIVIAALIKISKKSLTTYFYWAMALYAFIALFFFKLPFPHVVISSAVMGVIYSRFNSNTDFEEQHDLSLPKLSQTLRTFSAWVFIWFLPIILTYLMLGPSTFHHINIFFSKMSLVTFGGAYAALSYVAQQGVEVYHWLSACEMLDGLALAESTPGPLIQVVQHVGFLAAYNFPQNINPLLSGFIGSVLTTWMTFAPCFLFIFTFAPYIEFIRGKKLFSFALNAITASVVGVIFNLSLWFVLQALFNESNHLDFYALGICIIAFLMQFKFKLGLFKILFTSIILGIIKFYLSL